MLGSYIISTPGIENYKGVLSVLALTTGMLIFGAVILLKVEVWAHKQEVEVIQVAAETQWDGFLYQKAARDVLRQQKEFE